MPAKWEEGEGKSKCCLDMRRLGGIGESPNLEEAREVGHVSPGSGCGSLLPLLRGSGSLGFWTNDDDKAPPQMLSGSG